MRKLRDIIGEFRSHPVGYWFGLSPRCSYELSDQTIIKRAGDTVREFASIADITSWKSLDRRDLAIRFSDHSVVTRDSSGSLRSILACVVGDREDKDEIAEQSRCTEPGDDVAVSKRAPPAPGR